MPDSSTTSMHENPSTQHSPTDQRFTVTVDGVDAVLDYHADGAVMVITHTGVPSEIGGRGIARPLVEGAFKHARTLGWQVNPECSYAEAWVRRHPEYLSLLVNH